MIYCGILIFVIAVLVILLVLNCIYKHTNAYRNQFIDIDKFSHTESLADKSIDVVVLGSNAPKYAFDFSGIKDRVCENWAIGPETFEYDFVILKKFSRKLKKGAYIIWPVCPGKFFLDKYKNDSVFVKYYKLLESVEFPDYDKLRYKKDFKYPLIFHPKRLKYIIKDIVPDRKLDLEYNPMNMKEIENDAYWWIHSCWNPEFNIDVENMGPLSETNKRAVDYNISILKDAIDFCQSSGFHIVFAYLPLTNQLGKYFSDEYVKTYMTHYVMKAVNGNDIPLIDYMRDSRFQNTDYYVNSFFMNRTGARKFTEIFMEENIDKVH